MEKRFLYTGKTKAIDTMEFVLFFVHLITLKISPVLLLKKIL